MLMSLKNMCSRCMIPQIDSELNGTSPSFNFTLLEDFIPVKPDGELDQCHKYVSEFDHNTTECNGAFVYDDTYYHSSRVIDVSRPGIYYDTKLLQLDMNSNE